MTLGLPARLALGVIAGAALGAVAGFAEAILRPLGEPLRVPYAVGADGLAGAAWGLLVSLLLPGRRGRDPASVLAAVLGLGAGAALAAGLGMWANRSLLTRAGFLSPVSLAVDGACVAVAMVVAWGISRAVRARLLERGLRVVPHPLTALLAVVFLAAGVVAPPRLLVRAGDAALPPVILVSIDTLRPDGLSAGGEPMPTSPHLDRLCREGTLWPDAVTPSPGSAAGHAALLTARYPVSTGVWRNFAVLDGSVETLAERLRARGYRTGGFVTNTFLGRRFGFEQGFDTYVESGITERLREPSAAGLFRSLALVQILDRVRYRLDPRHDASFAAALDWLQESRRPAFLFVHLMDVHAPYVPPSPWAERFGAGPEGEPGSPDHRNKFGWRPSTAAYLAEIAWVDAKVGRLVRALQARGLDGGVLMLASDHGENLLDHAPHYTHGSTQYESTLRVLAAMRAPGRLGAGTVDPRTFELVDFLPTLAGVLGEAPSPEWEGRDLSRAGTAEPPFTVGQMNRDFAVRTRDRKVMFAADGTTTFYRLDEDPGETRAAPADSALRAAAAAELAAFLDRWTTPLYEESPYVDPAALPEDVRERLRSLGYQN